MGRILTRRRAIVLLAAPALVGLTKKGRAGPIMMLGARSRAAAGDLNADWEDRSTGPGVVWAQRFTSSSDVDRMNISNNANVTFVPGGGIIGDGCARLNVPAGIGGSGSVGRPLAPINGDINNAGLTPLAITISNNSQVTSQFNNMVGGHFGHSSYHSTWPGRFVSTDFYLQYRVKFSANRFNSDEPTGKMMMLVTNYQTPNQELVALARTDYGGGWYFMYTNIGATQLTDPQDESGDASFEPGGVYDATCVESAGSNAGNGTSCYNYRPTGQWQTILLHLIPGRNRVNGNLNDPANPHETGIEVWVAKDGETSYRKIWEKFDYVWLYDTGITEGPGGGPMPFGWNWINWSPFTGGPVALPSVNGWYHEHDQLICSKEFIPCPAI